MIIWPFQANHNADVAFDIWPFQANHIADVSFGENKLDSPALHE